MDFGFSSKQALSILKYKNKIGGFYKVEDLERVYVINSNHLDEIKKYFLFKKKVEDKNVNGSESKNSIILKIEINHADSVDLMKLNGIGPKFSSRIIKFRKKLGGFYDISQLLEVYGIDSQLYVKLLPYLEVNNTSVKKIQINNANLEDLVTHPYIGYRNALIIKNFVSQHGALKSVEDLRKVNIFDDKQINKLIPYIIF